MAKVLVIPDVFMDLDFIKKCLALKRKVGADTVVMTGNYLAFWGRRKATPKEKLEFLRQLRELLKHDNSIIPLIGEAELQYFENIAASRCLDINYKVRDTAPLDKVIADILINDARFLPAVAIDGVLYTHAGVSLGWIRDFKILQENEIRFRLGHVCGAGIIEKAILGLPTWRAFFAYPKSKIANSPYYSCIFGSLAQVLSDAPHGIKQVVGHYAGDRPELLSPVFVTLEAPEGKLARKHIVIVNDGEATVVPL